jgi:hypothetical protein
MRATSILSGTARTPLIPGPVVSESDRERLVTQQESELWFLGDVVRELRIEI